MKVRLLKSVMQRIYLRITCGAFDFSFINDEVNLVDSVELRDDKKISDIAAGRTENPHSKCPDKRRYI